MNLTLWIPILVAITSASGAFVGTWFSARMNAKTAGRQSKLQVAVKVADFRQAWINQLRDALSEFQSYGITPGLEHSKEREFYRLGTKIELLMNRADPSYDMLDNLLYRFLSAETIEEKYSCNAEFVSVSQEILKREWETLKRELRTDGILGK